MRFALNSLVLLAFAGCDNTTATSEGEFHPIGLTDADQDDAGSVVDQGATTVLPLRLRFEPIEQDSGALRITDMAFAPNGDDRFIVTDKDGEVILMRMEVGRARRLSGFVVPDTWSDSDAGLIAVTFDPDFDQNGFFYLGVSISQETNVIRRYTFNTEDFARSGETAVDIITVTGPNSPRAWHNVGSMGFTDEGYLWALFGEKVLDQYALDVTSPLGSLVRIIPDHLPFPESDGGYAVPADNPYADGSGHPAVYAKGFRSPWKGLYRDGRWFTSDVGLDTYEEVNLIDRPGQVFGWPAIEGPCEGAACAGYAPPWIAYGRSSSHPFVREDPESTASRLRSAWVGWQYVPNERDPYGGRWNNVLTFGDAWVGWIRGRRTDGQGESWAVAHHTFVTGWAQAPDGYVYVTALGTWPVDAPVTPSPIMRAVLE